ncbi:signal peptidase II [Candidatus Woesearchaeota archaeon]|nr:signal peptidase II [Candidatus Woesearchaeota archaeon]
MKSTDKKKALIIFLISLSIIILDQLIKFIIIKKIPLNSSIKIIPKIFSLTHIHNYGAAFGLFQNASQLLIWFSIIIIGVILYMYDKIPKEKIIQIFVALVLGGTLGNLIDRIRFGYVIDFLNFKIWPAFNLADSAITIGIIGLIIYLIKKE